MKRMAIAAAAVVALLAAAGTAFAAVNSYKASYSFSGGKGTAAKPAPLSFNQTINVTSGTAGNRTGILKYIKTTINGVKVDASGFPTCTASQISANNNDTKCNKKALVATGSIKALVGPTGDFSTGQGIACDPELHVWNAGKGKLAFFFVETGSHQCLGGQLTTGTVPAWTATYRQAGSNLDVTIPIPHDVDYPVAGDVGSLTYEHLDWKSQSMNGHNSIETVACSGKRNFAFTFSASSPSAGSAVNTVKGSSSCN